MDMSFGLTDLRAFVSVADLGSFRAASATLHLTQPAVSRRIDKLEQALGFRLFDRTTRRVELNAMGRSFLPRARHVLNELETALLGMTDMAGRLSGQVTIACVPSAVATLVANAMREFHSRFPRIRVRVIDESATNILLAVAHGDADFGISYLGTQEPDLEFEPLFEEDFVLACPIDHPLARRRRVRWSELAQYDCVMLAPGSANRMLVDQALGSLTLRPNWSCEVHHVPALLSLIEARIGVGAVPRFAVPMSGQSVLATVPLVEPRVVRTVGKIRRRVRELSPAARAFHDLLAKPHTARRTVSTATR
jgi:DNA-binding transcriptional LysR family regulator